RLETFATAGKGRLPVATEWFTSCKRSGRTRQTPVSSQVARPLPLKPPEVLRRAPQRRPALRLALPLRPEQRLALPLRPEPQLALQLRQQHRQRRRRPLLVGKTAAGTIKDDRSGSRSQQ